MKKILSSILSSILIFISPCISTANTQPSALNVTVNTSSFSKNLSPSDSNVQAALNTIDQLSTSGSSGWTITDGSHTVAGVTNLTVSGGVVSGTSPNAVLTISGSPAAPLNSFQFNSAGLFSGGNMFSSGNNVGIGSLSPGTILDVNGTLRTTGFILSTNATSGYILTSNNVGIGTWQPPPSSASPGGSSGNIQYNNGVTFAGNSGFNYDASGNVGIGTVAQSNNPLYTFNSANSSIVINQSGNNSAGSFYRLLAPTGGNAKADLFYSNPGSSGSNLASIANSFGLLGGSSTTGGMVLDNTAAAPIIFAVGGTATNNEVMRISSANNVGIGSISPGQKFDVQGTIRSTGMQDSALTSSSLVFTDANKILTSTGSITLSGDITGSGTTAISTTLKNTGTSGTYRSTTFDAQGRETSGTNPTTFAGYAILDSSANLRAALTDPTGLGSAVFATGPNLIPNVGIGSTAPGQALDIQGTARMQGFILTTNPNSGYVLTSNAQGIGTWAPTSSGNSTVGSNLLFGNGSGGFTNVNNTLTNGTNIGIGTATPGVTFDVQGTIRTTNFTLTTGAHSGYVLTSDGNGISSWTSIATGGGTVSSGTPGQEALYTGTTTVGSGIITDNGTNVGISSTAPGAKLDVQGSIRASLGIFVGSQPVCQANGTNCPPSGGSAAAGLNAVQYNSPLGSFAGKEQTFSFNGTNVGIGTSSGTSLLDVRGNSSVTGNQSVTGTSSLTGNVGVGVAPGSTPLFVQASGGLGVGVRSITGNNLAYLTSEGSSGPTAEYGNLILANNNTQLISLDANNNPNLSIKSNTSNPVIYLGANGSSGAPAQQGILETEDTGVVVDVLNAGGPSYINAGNFGIGSVNPGQLFDVHGTARVSGFVLPTNAASGYILTSNAVGIGTWQPAATSGSSGTVTSVQISSPNSTLTVGGTNPITTSGIINADLNLTNNNTWTGQQIFNTANVGINSAAPGQTLDVHGTARSSQFIDLGVTASKVVVTSAAQQFTAATNLQDLAYCQTGGTNCPGGITGFANPTGTIGLTANNGSAVTAMRSDATPALSQTISPTMTGNWTFSPSSGSTLFSVGNVSIGTDTTPDGTLEVTALSGTPPFLVSSTNTKDGDFLQVSSVGNVGINSMSPGSILDIQGTARIYGNVGIGTSPTSYTLMVNGPTQIIGVGNVGIGSLAPGSALDVNGTIRSSEFSTQASGTLLCIKTGGGIGYCSGTIIGIGCTCN